MKALALLLGLAALAAILRAAAPALIAVTAIMLLWAICFRLREVLLFIGSICLGYLSLAYPAWFCALMVAIVTQDVVSRRTPNIAPKASAKDRNASVENARSNTPQERINPTP